MIGVLDAPFYNRGKIEQKPASTPIIEREAARSTGDPKKRSPAVKNGRAHKKPQSLAASEASKYYPSDSVARVSVYLGRNYLGPIFEADGAHQAFDAAGVQIGAFANRTDAARAFSRVRS